MSGNAPQVPDTLTGRCMCGAVTYKIAEKPMVDGLCHCNRCRPQSGTAFSTVIFIHRSALMITGVTAGFEDIESAERAPYEPSVEAQTHRCYMVARRLGIESPDR